MSHISVQTDVPPTEERGQPSLRVERVSRGPESVLGFQRTAGNQAVARWMASRRALLRKPPITVGRPGKAYDNVEALIVAHPELVGYRRELSAILQSDVPAPPAFDTFEDVLSWLHAHEPRAGGAPAAEQYMARMRDLAAVAKELHQFVAGLQTKTVDDVKALFRRAVGVRIGVLNAVDDYINLVVVPATKLTTSTAYKPPDELQYGLLFIEETYNALLMKIVGRLNTLLKPAPGASPAATGPKSPAAMTREAEGGPKSPAAVTRENAGAVESKEKGKVEEQDDEWQLWQAFADNRVFVVKELERYVKEHAKALEEMNTVELLKLKPLNNSEVIDLLTRLAILLHFRPTRTLIGKVAMLCEGLLVSVYSGSKGTVAALPFYGQKEKEQWSGKGTHTGIGMGQEREATDLLPGGKKQGEHLVPAKEEGQLFSAFALQTREIVLAHELSHVLRQLGGGWGAGFAKDAPDGTKSAFQKGEEYKAIAEGEGPLRELLGIQLRGHASASVPLNITLGKKQLAEIIAYFSK